MPLQVAAAALGGNLSSTVFAAGSCGWLGALGILVLFAVGCLPGLSLQCCDAHLAEVLGRTNSRTLLHHLPARSACGETSRIISFA
jgi:hypothetical protein